MQLAWDLRLKVGGTKWTCPQRCGCLGERLNNDPSGNRYGCFLPDLTELAKCLPAPTPQFGR